MPAAWWPDEPRPWPWREWLAARLRRFADRLDPRPVR